MPRQDSHAPVLHIWVESLMGCTGIKHAMHQSGPTCTATAAASFATPTERPTAVDAMCVPWPLQSAARGPDPPSFQKLYLQCELRSSAFLVSSWCLSIASQGDEPGQNKDL